MGRGVELCSGRAGHIMGFQHSLSFLAVYVFELESKMKMISKSAGYSKTPSNSSISEGRLTCSISEQGIAILVLRTSKA